MVVPVGSLQAENGFLVTSLRGQNNADGSETLVRVGILARTGFRFTAPDYYYDLSGSGIGTGFGDLALGVKEPLGPLPGKFDVYVTAFVSFLTGASGVSSGGYDPGLPVAWSRPLSSKWTTAGKLSLYGLTQGHAHNLIGESALLLDWQLTALWDVGVGLTSAAVNHFIEVGYSFGVSIANDGFQVINGGWQSGFYSKSRLLTVHIHTKTHFTANG